MAQCVMAEVCKSRAKALGTVRVLTAGYVPCGVVWYLHVGASVVPWVLARVVHLLQVLYQVDWRWGGGL